MADNLNTFKNIGDTVSFDSLYRGIENMGKAIASARAAKAKAEAKKNDETMKMVMSKQAETGMTPLWSINNLGNYTNFINTATNKIASNPNTGMNDIPVLYAEYQQKAQLTKAQSLATLPVISSLVRSTLGRSTLLAPLSFARSITLAGRLIAESKTKIISKSYAKSGLSVPNFKLSALEIISWIRLRFHSAPAFIRIPICSVK